MNQQPEPFEHPTAKALRLGRLLVPMGTAARASTDVGAHGEVHAYLSGTSIFLGMYDATNGAWCYVEMTP